MAIKGHCGGGCGECRGCRLDKMIPCSPNCENLTPDGMINIDGCLRSKCEEVKYIFDMEDSTDDEIVERYGEIAPYPYNIL